MSGYRYYACRACRRDLPVALCAASLRVCVGRVSRLARLPFVEVWSRYGREFDLTGRSGIQAAVVRLEAERDYWLGRHELYAAFKWNRVGHGGRFDPPPPEVAGPLYGARGSDDPVQCRQDPVIYVVWRYRPSSGIGCQLVKKPLGYRAALQQAAQPCRVSGPFCAREVVVYLRMIGRLARKNETWRSAVEEFVRSTADAVEL